MTHKICLFVAVLIFLLPIKAAAVEYTAPEVPKGAAKYMPEDTESFADGLWSIVKSGISTIRPSIAEASGTCAALIAICMLLSLAKNFSGLSHNIADITGCLMISMLLLRTSDSLILLGLNTIKELTDYGKLLIPVLTGSLAAQGGIVSSGELFVGTSIFSTILSWFISALLRPMIYIYLALTVVKNITSEPMLRHLSNSLKWVFTWGLKICLYVFTGYMSITGVISGSTDAAQLKITKLTISGMVPVIGGILSDASESVLVSAGLIKNTAGIYGLLAIGAILIEPFFLIGSQYLLLKATAAVSEVFECKSISNLIKDFSTTMGFVLAMVGSVSVLLLVSVVCFMKVVT